MYLKIDEHWLTRFWKVILLKVWPPFYKSNFVLKGIFHDWANVCLQNKNISHEILIEFLQKVINKLQTICERIEQ